MSTNSSWERECAMDTTSERRTDPPLTCHASARSQQRSIPPFAIKLLLEYGASMRHQGAEVWFIYKAARRRIRREVGCHFHSAIERFLDAYVVRGDDGQVITVGWRIGRLKHP